MTRHIAITKRKAKTLLRAAAEEGGIVEVVTVIGTVRLIPGSLAKADEDVDKEPKGHF